MRELGGLGEFMRGSESVAHGLSMLRAAVKTLVIYTLIASPIVVMWLYFFDMDATGREVVFDALVFEYFTKPLRSLSNDPVVVASPTGQTFRVSVLRASQLYTNWLGGRPPWFVGRSWGLHMLVSALVVGPTMALSFLRYGQRLVKGQHLRGAELIDTMKPAYRYRRARAATETIVLVSGFVFVVAVAVMSGGVNSLVRWWVEELTAVSPWLLSMREHAGSLWSGGRFVSIDQALAQARADAGVSRLALSGASAGAMSVGLLVAFIVARRRFGRDDPTLLSIGGIPVPRMWEVYSFLVCGNTGAGKSVAITPMCKKIRERGQRAIIFDTSGEYIERFYRPGHDAILNPLDARCAPWTPWGEIRTRADYLAMGKSLFPQISNNEKFWSIAGASLFASVAAQAPKLGYDTNRKLAHKLTTATLADVAKAVEGTTGKRFMDRNAGPMSQNLLATLSGSLESLLFLRDLRPGEEAFSIKRFIEEPSDKWLFISMRGEDEASIRPLISLWYDIAINAALALPNEPHETPMEQRRRIFFLLDELARLQKLEGLDAGVREGRKKGMSFLLGLQSVASMRHAYGNDVAESILGQPQTMLVLRTTHHATAEWLEKALGKAELERTVESQSYGANSQRDGVNLNRQRKDETVVMASEIQNLPNCTGFLKLPSAPIRKVNYGFTNIPSVNAGFTLATPVEPYTDEELQLEAIIAEAKDRNDRLGPDSAISFLNEQIDDFYGVSSVMQQKLIGILQAFEAKLRQHTVGTNAPARASESP